MRYSVKFFIRCDVKFFISNVIEFFKLLVDNFSHHCHAWITRIEFILCCVLFLWNMRVQNWSVWILKVKNICVGVGNVGGWPTWWIFIGRFLNSLQKLLIFFENIQIYLKIYIVQLGDLSTGSAKNFRTSQLLFCSF